MDEWFPGLGDKEEDGLPEVHVLVDKKCSITGIIFFTNLVKSQGTHTQNKE